MGGPAHKPLSASGAPGAGPELGLHSTRHSPAGRRISNSGEHLRGPSHRQSVTQRFSHSLSKFNQIIAFRSSDAINPFGAEQPCLVHRLQPTTVFPIPGWRENGSQRRETTRVGGFSKEDVPPEHLKNQFSPRSSAAAASGSLFPHVRSQEACSGLARGVRESQPLLGPQAGERLLRWSHGIKSGDNTGPLVPLMPKPKMAKKSMSLDFQSQAVYLHGFPLSFLL